ncbi:effector binding domain-containing protein [Listeria monocytogenes]|nr:AraC family transcriptional regulator [Listeria monocytogenes]EAE3666267.1 AraC family transcriptional regulator [Listeria monocytogenes]EAE5882108.1 AraC family transcriptional regulator [Listeria monocytogenes]EAE5884866.1 AraC family transcriptional regulator [Listeria monocytogenes]EHK9356553.1 effector binding domain-containing protein [Listeria monocytogenes]
MAIRLKRLEEWEGFTGIALVREGLKTEALHTEIKTAFKEMLQLARELDDFSKQKTFYGISVHNIEDGITHYSVIPVEQKYPHLQEPLEWIEVPAHTYFVAEHIQDTDISESYEEIARAIQEKITNHILQRTIPFLIHYHSNWKCIRNKEATKQILK